VPDDLAIFSPSRGRPKTVLNGRLPEITARDVSPIVPLTTGSSACCANRPNPRRDVRGSRLFKAISGHSHPETNTRGRLVRSKAAPLQAWTPSILPRGPKSRHRTAFFNPAAAGRYCLLPMTLRTKLEPRISGSFNERKKTRNDRVIVGSLSPDGRNLGRYS
jgi:hypothetical protein